MKSKPLYVTSILLTISIALSGFTALMKPQQKTTSQIRITASFYPVYIAAMNITENVDGVQLSILSQPSTGCLHDYQLTPQDLTALEKADLFIINGGGMEGYLNNVTQLYSQLPIISSSDGISMTESREHHHHHDEAEEHEHDDEEEQEEHDEELNSHVWMNPQYYMSMVDNIARELKEYDPAHAKQYIQNAEAYKSKITSVLIEYAVGINGGGKNTITFHESMDYLCAFLKLNVVHGITIESESALSANEAAEIIDKTKENCVSLLIGDMQYPDTVPKAISHETGVKLLMLDSCVSGELNQDAYLTAMKNNLDLIKEALA